MRTAMITTVLALVAAGQAAAQTPSRFDLVCQGTERRTEAGRYGDDQRPARTSAWRGHLRVDVSSRRWCIDRCALTTPMAGSGPGAPRGGLFAAPLQPPSGVMVIGDFGEHNQEWDSRYTVLYRPTDGELRMDGMRADHITGRRTSTIVEARCTQAPFSGFPRRPGR